MKTVIKNISELIQTETTPRKWVAGKDMSHISTIKDAFIEVEEGIITSFGSMENWNGIEDWNNTDIIDAEGGMVFPTYCDSHTHLVFAASREGEFVDRINGLSYAEIAERGGGILNSADKLQNASEDELYEDAFARLNELVQIGTGAIEIKSGYGLTLDAELKMLRVIKRLKVASDVTIKATFLGAHALPKEYKDNKDGYMDLVINEMLPIVAKEGLADYVDIFCEDGYFTVEDTKNLLTEANKLGLQSKTHVNQFKSIGGVKVSVDLGALSVDHLEEMAEEDYEALKPMVGLTGAAAQEALSAAQAKGLLLQDGLGLGGDDFAKMAAYHISMHQLPAIYKKIPKKHFEKLDQEVKDIFVNIEFMTPGTTTPKLLLKAIKSGKKKDWEAVANAYYNPNTGATYYGDKELTEIKIANSEMENPPEDAKSIGRGNVRRVKEAADNLRAWIEKEYGDA